MPVAVAASDMRTPWLYMSISVLRISLVTVPFVLPPLDLGLLAPEVPFSEPFSSLVLFLVALCFVIYNVL